MEEKKTTTKPEGGFCLIAVSQMLRAWEAYREERIEFRDLRVWFAAHEVVGRRCTMGRERKPSFRIEELAQLVGGIGGEHVRASVRRLEASGLLSWSSSAITFPKVEGGERKDQRLVPVPRRTLRFMAGSSKPALVATMVGHMARCLFYRNGKCRPTGNCRASWVAEVFGVTERSVKAARKELVKRGWVRVEESKHWHKQRWGGRFTVNLTWADGGKETGFSPRKGLSTTGFSPPYKQETLSESRYQKLGGEPSGVKKQDPGRPRITNIKLEDLTKFARAEELYWQAVDRGIINHSENQALNWLAAVVRATSVAGNPVRVFAGIVRKGLWRNITQAQEDMARRALTRYREVRPESCWVERMAAFSRSFGGL